MRLVIVFAVAFLLAFNSLRADLPVNGKLESDTTMEEIQRMLEGNGLQGWIHGAVNEYSQYVFTYRVPGNFFDHYEFPITTENPEVKKFLESSNRHDEVIIRGSFLANGAPIQHIDAKEIYLYQKFEDGLGHGKYTHEAKLPEELEGKTELKGKVHAIVDGGKVLVIEYKDAIIPVVVPKPELAKDLYRNDKITLQYKLRKHPHLPAHVAVDVSKTNPIVVTDSLVKWHMKQGSLTGTLVLFPKSPQVQFNVFALQVVDNDGVKREITLVNFDDPKAFEAIRNKLQEWWDEKPQNIINARNKYLNLNVQVKATGTFNVVDPGQANMQILLKGPENIERSK
ncbi:MAG: hypothetical protein EBR01_06170 [Proteobacteria bacterium]|nr:hypothetical protein [Pseudomonadota bacterium]